MDNLTHSLVGVAMAEAAVQMRRRQGKPLSTASRQMLFWVSLVSNNFPDWDIVYTTLMGGRLSYLLHHRGHTHTLILILPQVAALLYLCYRLSLWRDMEISKKDWRTIGLVSVLGMLVHLGMDGLNSYGIHPFWPFANHWIYGDALFIVEPWIWVSLLPVFFLGNFRAKIRIVFAFLFVVALLLTWFSGYVPWYMALLVSTWGIGMWRLLRNYAPGRRIFIGSASVVFVIILFLSLSFKVRGQYKDRFSESSVGSQLLDVVLNPLPSNPFCWWIFSVESYDKGRSYRVRLGMLAPFSGVISARKCPALRLGQGTAKLLATDDSGREDLLWFGEFRASSEGLKTLSEKNCHVRAFLKYARVPYYQSASADIIMGDLRYDFERGLGFAEIQIPANPVGCPGWEPNWEPPRQDLFQSVGSEPQP